ncbi:WD40 repeat domain-containing protein [Nonomuraea purpurea]|uniref:WD40 repeat domain-containing protein n=1 Tax=Nonomuraea purpurea TaxID=1849276 RepID=A0ABV8GQM9_9ACTN
MHDLEREPFEDHADRVTAVALSPDGAFGVTATCTGEVRLWRLPGGRRRRGQLLAAVSGPHRGPVRGALFLPGADPVRLVTVGAGALRWTIEKEAVEWRRLVQERGMRSPVLAADGQSIFTAIGEDVRWWSQNDQRGGRVPGHRGLVAIALARGGLIICGNAEGGVRCLPAQDPGRASDVRTLWSYTDDEPAPQRLLRVCDRGRLVVSPRRDRVVVLDAGSGDVVTAFEPPARPTAIAAHAEAPLVAIGCRDGSLTWWDARSGRSLGHVPAHEGRIGALAMGGNDLVLSASQDGSAALWRLHGHAPLGRFEPAPPSRPTVGYGREDVWELGVAAGSPDGRQWLIGGHGGQVHVLEWRGDGRLVPVRAGWPGRMAGETDVEGLLDDLRDHRTDPDAGLAAGRAFVELGYPEEDHDEVVAALRALTVDSAEADVREQAMIVLAEADEAEATTAAYTLFDSYRGVTHGLAGRLLTHFTSPPPTVGHLNPAEGRAPAGCFGGVPLEGSSGSAAGRLPGDGAPTVASLVAVLPEAGSLLGVVISEALAERGAAAFPAVHEALRSVTGPSRVSSGDWSSADTTVYRLVRVLIGMGRDAAAATPTLMALVEDDEVSQHTRYQARLALTFIGLPETVDALAAEILRRDREEGCHELLRVLSRMSGAALAEARLLPDALAAVERLGDGHELHLADLIRAELDKNP